MRHFTFSVFNKNELKIELEKTNIPNTPNTLIQIFSGILNPETIKELAKELKEKFTKASIIGATTAGEICGEDVLHDSFTVAITQFEKSTIKAGVCINSNSSEAGEMLAKQIDAEHAKACIVFSDGLKLNGDEVLSAFTANAKSDAIIAGGAAGDYNKLIKTYTIFGDMVLESAAVGVAIFSDELRVFNAHNLGWKPIGRQMKITKAQNGRIYEIDGKKPKDLYRHYLGDEVVVDFPANAFEFPFVFEENGVTVARAVISYFEDGSVSYAGNIPLDKPLQFAFATQDLINAGIADITNELAVKEPEAIFMYSCTARKAFFDSNIKCELSSLNKVSKPSGFFTYGEFFKTCTKSSFLNITTTVIGFSEEPLSTSSHEQKPNKALLGVSGAIANLINTVAKELEERSKELNDAQNYINQYQKIVEDSFIVSRVNIDGVIMHVNQKFEDTSGYAKEELVGKHFTDTRQDKDKKAALKAWDNLIKNGGWSGPIRLKKKDMSSYMVYATTAPIKDIDGNIKEFISIRQDITELDKYRQILKNELKQSIKDLECSGHILKEYDKALNEASAFIKMAPNGKILNANNEFRNMSRCAFNCDCTFQYKDLLDERSLHLYDEMMRQINSGEIYKNIFIHKSCTDEKRIFVKITAIPIRNHNGKIAEVFIIFNDITDLIALQDELENSQIEIINTIDEIAEQRSQETGLHVKRVSEYSAFFAKKYGLSEDDIELVKTASPMHDIGKIAIPDSILLKPAKLTQAEFELMKEHSRLGYDMLKHSERKLLKTSAIIALTHHENWDGSGYPRGLIGEEIPIFGRIVSIADVFDALGHDRIYKKAWNIEDICAFIKEQDGIKFDPKLVEIFFNNLDEILEIKAKFQD